MNEQTLELQIKSSASDAKSAVDKLVKSLTNVENVVTNMYLELGRIESKSNSTINRTTKDVEKLRKTTDKATTSTSKLGSALKGAFTFAGVKRLTMTALGWMNEAIDYTEQLNLFNVVFDNTEKNGKQMFSELGKSALNFQYRLNEAFGTNKTQTLYMQGIFQSMGETVGIDDKYSAIMSETMTKLTYDLASLYNKTESATAEAIRAGVYAGQTKPLRSYGIDVTQMSMQPILDSLGIDEQVKNMSQAEKEILRYLATMKQAQIAMGDLANTIESPSNQLKVFRQQLVEAKVDLSSLFIGGLSNILPYANAFLMVTKEVSNAIATMFGIELKDYNSGIASQDGIYDGIADSADDASKAVKELKRQTLGFDETHNINENKDSGSGTDASGGIDQRLLDAITGYDNGMDKVRMKATEIRDRIMEWLGFTKEIDPLTGEVSFKYQGIKKTLSNVWKSFKGMSTEGKILVGLGLVVGATKLVSAGKKLVTVFGASGLGKVIKGLYNPTYSLFTTTIAGLKGTHSSLKTGIQSWREQMGIINSTTGKVDGFKGALNGAKTAMSGLITGAIGLYTVHQSMKSISEEGANLANVLGLVTGSLSTIASGVQIGAIFGPWGAVIGGAVSAIALLIDATSAYQTETDKLINKVEKGSEEMLAFGDSVMKVYEEIDNTTKNKLSLHEENQKLIDELETLVDANGNVLSGYEDRVDFILNQLNNAYGTEYKAVDGQIQKYDELTKNIQALIKQKQIEIIMEGKTEAYTKAIESKSELLKKYRDQKKSVKELQKEYDKTEEKMAKLATQYKNGEISLMEYNVGMNNIITDSGKLKEKLDEANSKMTEYTDDVVKNEKIISDYTSLSTASITGNMEDIDKAINETTDSFVADGKIITNSLAENIENLDIQYNELGTMTKEEYDRQKKNLLETLKNMSQTTDELTPEIVEAWGYLAENSESEFMEKFEKLPDDVQTEIVDKMNDKGYNISNELQKGINKINPTINVKADTSGAKNTINNWVNGLKNTFLGFGFSSVGGGGFRANGGIYYNGNWKDIPQYANGGAPSHGSMFVAGEKGAEIVGHINGRTEVLNQSQIASAIYNAMVSAMSQYSSQSSEIDVHVHTDEGTVIDRIEQRTKQTGKFPFTIPTY